MTSSELRIADRNKNPPRVAWGGVSRICSIEFYHFFQLQGNSFLVVCVRFCWRKIFSLHALHLVCGVCKELRLAQEWRLHSFFRRSFLEQDGMRRCTFLYGNVAREKAARANSRKEHECRCELRHRDGILRLDRRFQKSHRMCDEIVSLIDAEWCRHALSSIGTKSRRLPWATIHALTNLLTHHISRVLACPSPKCEFHHQLSIQHLLSHKFPTWKPSPTGPTLVVKSDTTPGTSPDTSVRWAKHRSHGESDGGNRGRQDGTLPPRSHQQPVHAQRTSEAHHDRVPTETTIPSLLPS